MMSSADSRVWAARYNTWLLIKLTPKGLVFSFLFFFLLTHVGCVTGQGGMANDLASARGTMLSTLSLLHHSMYLLGQCLPLMPG